MNDQKKHKTITGIKAAYAPSSIRAHWPPQVNEHDLRFLLIVIQ
ncbi:MAG: hypothetical protein ACOYBR_10700 [Fluviibacter sp.]